MRIGVVGGTGTLGSRLVAELLDRGHLAIALSRRPPEGGGACHRRLDLTRAEGMIEALSGLDAVVDASNVGARSRSMRKVLVEGTQRLLRAEAAAGIEPHVLVSIVGIEQVPLPYYRVKLEQERALTESRPRAGILRATQFHQLIDRAFRASSRLGVLPAARIALQPIDAREVARALADGIEQGRWEGRRELAGPQILTLTELARAWMRAGAKRRLLVPVPVAGRVGRALRAGALTSARAPRGQLGFAEWVSAPPRRPGVTGAAR